MAELKTDCCLPQAQETCCEESESLPAAANPTAAGADAQPDRPGLDDRATATVEQVREAVREKYAAAAASGAACCGSADDAGVFGAALYADSGENDAPEAAINASLGCGVPTAVADLHEARRFWTSGPAPAPTF